jgi:hypothetical protein
MTPAEFMSRVVPWPGAGEPGFINIHWRLIDKTDPSKSFMAGRAFNSLTDFMGMVHWAVAAPNNAFVKDIYFCTSLQKEHGECTNGKPKAKRGAPNALAFKAIWLDVDVKAAPKGYPTAMEAAKAVCLFAKSIGIPEPTAFVATGGGIHAYWISDRPLTVDEWRPYAEGLKAKAIEYGLRADHMVTADAARILRVPGTYNFKQVVPRDVSVRKLDDNDIDFAAKLGHIAITTPKITVAVTKPTEIDFSRIDPKTVPAWALAAIAKDESLADGINKATILDWQEVERHCPFFKDAKATGGASHAEPLWSLALLASTFFENGATLAHELSNGHPDYAEDKTAAKYAQKKHQREQNNLGYPSCTAFQAAASAQCAGCPHFNKIKSPLNLGLPTSPPLEAITGRIPALLANPVTALRDLYARGASLRQMLQEFNKRYAVVKYGSEVLIASIFGDEIATMKEQDFHKSFANLVFYEETETGKKRKVKASRKWFEWKQRRQYLGRGIVFDPSGPPDIPDDMLNLWRGFGIEPKPGDWSLIRKHLFEVICSGNQTWFDYLLGWMAHAVQQRDKPIGVAVALRGEQGAGKGVVARTFGNLFGKHFAHIANGDQLTGRFNAVVAQSCVVFLDEALWAGDRKGEGVLKALITEPTLTLEAKFRDAIMVDNRLRIIVASNNEWLVPAGLGDRRWFVLNVPSTRKGEQHKAYWDALYSQIDNGGAAALLHDLLVMDLTKFNVRAIPATAAKAEQQAHSFRDVEAWIYQVLDEGRLRNSWSPTGMSIEKDCAYEDYLEFSKRQRVYRPAPKSLWGKRLKELLGPAVVESKKSIGTSRVRYLQFPTLEECRNAFVKSTGVAELDWGEVPYEPPGQGGADVSGLANDGLLHSVAPESGPLAHDQAFEFLAEPTESNAAALNLLTSPKRH